VDVDERLVRRLEAGAAAASLDLVDALRSLDLASPADGRALRGGALIAMGHGRYVNRAIGVTLDELSAADVDVIEQFFAEHCLPSMVELSSWAPAPTVAELSRRNYVNAWFRSVFVLDLSAPVRVRPTECRIERVGDDDVDHWVDVFAQGFGADHADARLASDEIARASRIVPGSHTFLASLNDQSVGCGSVQVVDGVAWLGGAATLPAFRQRGVQSALVAHRLRLATELGCDIAAVTALSNGPSARNLVRLGFQLTHTQVVVEQRATFGARSAS
jgi:GNAT superfamily N-acetyltransferase